MAEQSAPRSKLTREELLSYLRRREEEFDSRPYVAQALFGDDLSLVTETHPSMISTKVRMRLLLAASDPDREVPLVQVFLNEYNKEMINYERKGRLELLGALQALSTEGGDEGAVAMGR